MTNPPGFKLKDWLLFLEREKVKQEVKYKRSDIKQKEFKPSDYKKNNLSFYSKTITNLASYLTSFNILGVEGVDTRATSGIKER